KRKTKKGSWKPDIAACEQVRKKPTCRPDSRAPAGTARQGSLVNLGVGIVQKPAGSRFGTGRRLTLSLLPPPSSPLPSCHCRNPRGVGERSKGKQKRNLSPAERLLCCQSLSSSCNPDKKKTARLRYVALFFPQN
ncbi:MAG: hypothetical protein BJ554DRAFT_1095, partial [Olpidium bornovanus]